MMKNPSYKVLKRSYPALDIRLPELPVAVRLWKKSKKNPDFFDLVLNRYDYA